MALQDPYCAWDLLNEKCTKHNSGILDRSYFIQDVELGYGTGCPISQPGNWSNLSYTYLVYTYLPPDQFLLGRKLHIYIDLLKKIL